jgi:branched-subunit amino acid transport protein
VAQFEGVVVTAWLAVIAVGLGSYGMRVGPLLLRNHFEPPAVVDELIRHAGTAAVTALLVTSCLRVIDRGPLLPVIAALAVGAVLAWRGKPMYVIVLGGLACQWAGLLLL